MPFDLLISPAYRAAAKLAVVLALIAGIALALLAYGAHREGEGAARFFYLQQHAFGGRVENQTFGTATTMPAADLARLGDSLTAAHQRLAGVTIERLPWSDVFERYDRAHTLFYCDPPYWQTEGYGVPFALDEYKQLAARMRTCAGRVMLSINDHADMRRVFDGFWTERIGITYSFGNCRTTERREFGELVVCNWDAGAVVGLF